MAGILLICQDLIFTTKIGTTAQELGQQVFVVPSVAAALQEADEKYEQVMVDLSSPSSTTADDLRTLRDAFPDGVRLLAYGSHVDVERLREAREAGCDPVLPRSEFTKRLVEWISSPTP